MDELNARRMLKPDARCPKCGRPPALRIDEPTRDLYAGLPPDWSVCEYQCNREECRHVFKIHAGALQRAA